MELLHVSEAELAKDVLAILKHIQIATENGAKLLGELDNRGTIATGKAAGLALIDGNPAARIADIRKIKIVFKDGAGYDPVKLVDSVRPPVGGLRYPSPSPALYSCNFVIRFSPT